MPRTSFAARNVSSAIPVPRGSTITIRSRRLRVSRPSPTTPTSAIAAPITRSVSTAIGPLGIEVIRAVEIDGIDVVARHELLQIDDLRAFDVERLQFRWGKRDELAALVFVTLDDLSFLYLLAGAGIVRPQRDPGCRGGLIRLLVTIILGKSLR
jgi:hypothetical protein